MTSRRVDPTDDGAIAQVVPLVAARALDRALDYAVPDELRPRVVPGALVAVGLGPRTVLGVVVGRDPATHDGRMARVAGVVDAPVVPTDLLDVARWVAGRTLAPLGTCLKLVLPPGAEGALRRGPEGTWHLGAPTGQGRQRIVARVVDGVEDLAGRRAEVLRELRAGGGSMPAADLVTVAATTMLTLRRMADDGQIDLVRERDDARGLDWAGPAPSPDEPPVLTSAQQVAVNRIIRAMDSTTGEGLLLHGVTGSGKTEVYLRVIAEARARGQTSLILVPEIGLTPQLLGRLRARLGETVAVWHSALPPAQRAAEDRRIRSGEADVVIGARSAVFAPLMNLGVVIVDEEHDASYKQDSSPRYDARQVAYRRAMASHAALVYGSATPRPEAWHALERITLTERADGATLPPIDVVDMRTQPPGPVSRPLQAALQAAGERGEKAIILLNRRGFARTTLCRSCGWIARCRDCDVPMILHRAGGGDLVVCHHCGQERIPPTTCPACRSVDVGRQGSGTQALEEALAAVVPNTRLVRLDADSAARPGGIVGLLKEFNRPGPAILLGTQMVAKGHDLPMVTVAGILDADAGLQHPDFRAEERTFSLIVQLAGRAGRRKGEPARVVVQAWEPAARAVRLGAAHAVEEFVTGEIARRESRGMPPHGHLIRIVVEGESASRVGEVAHELADAVADCDPSIVVRGPSRLHRLRGRTRRAILLQAPLSSTLTAAVRHVALAPRGPASRTGVRIGIDVDPQET
ncbi:MAG: primosomal protein N' [Thermoleophilia bacterium]|nr:primosomal protein N' [Thermoleophilia bacterium]